MQITSTVEAKDLDAVRNMVALVCRGIVLRLNAEGHAVSFVQVARAVKADAGFETSKPLSAFDNKKDLCKLLGSAANIGRKVNH